jgi:CRISPR system Cascade subunit CasE
MFLSKVWIGWHWAKDPYQQHRALWQLFPDRPADERDFLFRVEDLQRGKGAFALLLSAVRPQTAPVAEVIACKPMPQSVSTGARLRFRLRANPIKTIKDDKRLDKKGQPKSIRVPLIHEEEQLNWLLRKFSGIAELETARVWQEPALFFRKQDMGGKIQPVCFEGVLTVLDNEALFAMLRQGIGPAKAMGCGLLSLAAA